MRNNIVVAGYADVDVIKTIEGFPQPHGLNSVKAINYALGGAACNCGLDLAKLDPNLTVKPLAVIGDDDNGAYIERSLKVCPNIDLSLLRRRGQTAFTDVLDEEKTRVRIFLVYRGANQLFDVDTVDVDELDTDLFHIGYICLLDALDQKDDAYGSRMARLLRKLRKAGIMTSVDTATDSTGRHRYLMPAAMKYADIFCVNEHEAGAAYGESLRRDDDTPDVDAMVRTVRRFREGGVAKWGIIHAPECVVGIDENDQIVQIPGAKLPEGYVRGTVGAGDAFVSGVLLGAKNGETLERAMRDGIAAAVTSLSRPGASEGVRPLAEARQILDDLT